MKPVTELNNLNELSQLTEDIKPEMALWRERELIPLLCHESDSRAKKVSLKSTEFNYL